MIIIWESLRMAFSSLRANPLRAVLTILGIVIGFGAVVALTSIGGGSTRSVENRFNAFGTDTITVETSRFASSSSTTTPLTASDQAAINKTPG
ncbi:MAG: ABC transporter permease, partial [Thermoleophilia bacterium]